MNKIFAAPLALMLLVPLAGWAHDEAGQNRRMVSVSGQGEISVKPDRARVSMGIEAFNAELKAAEGEVNKVARAFLAETKSLGIAEADLSTTGVTINPEYAWIEQTRTQKLTGYRASRQIEVLARDLDRLGDLILRATKAGVNRVSPPQLESSRAKDLTNQALVKAAEDARAKAKLLAETLGAKLGAIFRVSAMDAAPQPPVMYKVMAMRAEAADGNTEMGINTGEIRYNANVSADFELLAP
jgi:hypothetical protein